MNHPVPMKKQELLDLLDEIRGSVEADDSFEGFLQYTMPQPCPFDTNGDGDCGKPLCPFCGEDADAQFAVLARWRVGNSMGQGGLASVGTMEPPGDPTSS